MRYEEATKAAKKAVQLYNYILLAHLILAASSAHLGQLDEAKAAIKQSFKLNTKLTVAGLTDLLPISNYKNLDVFIEGLRKAGLPE
jgi:adenylate cyclase